MEQEAEQWAETEMSEANFGDKRLNKRVVDITKAFINCPEESIPQSTVDWAKTKGAYRFFDNEKVKPETILEPHRRASKRRLRHAENGVILAIQDTSQVHYNSHRELELGPGPTENGNSLFLHPTLIASDKGVPLGVIDQHIWVREELGSRGDRREKTIEEKESHKWMRGFRASMDFQAQNKGYKVVTICDREGDIYDLFKLATEAKQTQDIELLVRSSWDRSLENEELRLKNYIRKQDKMGDYRLKIERNGRRAERRTHLDIRFSPLTIKPPRSRRHDKQLKPIELWVVEAVESTPQKGKDAICWRLLTTYEVTSVEDAKRLLGWYSKRWLIEEYFKVLKSGCKIQQRQLRTLGRLENCLALDAIIAWRILFLVHIGRKMPDLPASLLFSNEECLALYSFINQTPDPPPRPLRLSDMIGFLAKLGGFLGRKGDGHPGAKVLWRGSWKLPDIVTTWLIFNS